MVVTPRGFCGRDVTHRSVAACEIFDRDGEMNMASVKEFTGYFKVSLRRCVKCRMFH